MRVLFDTNVVLDVLLARAPYAATATALLDCVARRQLTGMLGATSVTTLFYLAAKAVGATAARRHISTLLDLFEIAAVTRPVLAAALTLSFKDYEDAVLHEAARQADASGIVTRDPAGFRAASISVYTPDELLLLVRATQQRV